MGVCTCNGANNEIIARELAVPVQIQLDAEINKKEINRSPEKQNTKKMIHITKIKNNSNFSLSPVLNEMLNDKLLKSVTTKKEIDGLLMSQGEFSQRNKRNDILNKITEKEGGAQATKCPITKSYYSININQITTDQEDLNSNLPQNKQNFLGGNMKDIECSFSSKVISEREENVIMKGLKGHFLFWKFSEDLIKTLIDMLSLIQIEDDTYLFREKEKGSSFFIIKSGKVEIKSKKKARTLTRGSTFGELGLLRKDCNREYSAVAKGQIELYALSYETFNQVLVEYNIPQEEAINPHYIDNNYLLKELPIFSKQNLIQLARPLTLKAGDLIISTVKKSKLLPLIDNTRTLLFVDNGELSEVFYFPELRNKVAVGELTGIIYTMFKPHDKVDYEIIADDNCVCYVLPETALIEALGANYRYEILFSFFNSRIVKSTLIKELWSDLSNDSLFQGFNIKEYKSNDIVINHSNFDNKKMCMLLTGDLISSKNSKTKLSKGILYGDKLINSNEDLDYDIIAKKNATFTLECSWKDIKDILQKVEGNRTLFENYNYLSLVSLFRNLNESKIFEIAKYAKKEKHKKWDVLIPENTINDKFYLIVKGRVKLKDSATNKTIRVYDEGNCFGEFGLLNDAISPVSYKAADNGICYTITREAFYELLQDQHLNDYMKHKMILEDPEISIDDLYYLSYLGRGRFGNVCLVHNKFAFYAAKAVSKLAAEKQKGGVKNLMNEKNTMIATDHPFIVKLVKTLKKDNWCFLLQEFICGKNFGEYLDSRKIKKNVYETKFYGAILLVILDYLNKRHIVHRDIKPTNIMMDYNGYLKLIDFGTAKKLKNFSMTLIGTPNFIAPEILLGKGYSFPCDYWSVGVCLFYIYFGTLPFGHKALDMIDIYKEIIEKEPDFPLDSPFEIKNLLSALLTKRPTQRLSTLEDAKEQNIYKDFLWDDLLKFRLKPFFVPYRDPRDNPANLTILTSPFQSFMECEKFETIQMQTLKINNTKEMNRSNSTINIQWFEEF